jgi:hypothetical protein
MWSVARYFFRKLPGVSNIGIFALASGVLAVLVYTFLDSRSLDAQQFYSNMNAVIQLREISDILEKSLLQSRSAQPEDFENIKLSFSVAQEVSQDLKKSLSSSLWFDQDLQRQLQTYIDSLRAKETLFHELEAAKTVEEKNQVFAKLVAIKTASQLSSFSDSFLVGNKAALNRNSRHKFILYFLVMLLGTYMALAMVQLRYAKEAIKKQYDLLAHQQETLTQTAKLSDWMNASASGTIAVANNMRISSPQASSTTPVVLTGANVYSSPLLNITGDLDPNMPGKQVKVLVEVAVPVNTVNGSYTTTYSVKSQ